MDAVAHVDRLAAAVKRSRQGVKEQREVVVRRLASAKTHIREASQYMEGVPKGRKKVANTKRNKKGVK